MANSPRRLPRDVRHPPFLPPIFCQRRGSSPPGAPDQGCKSRNVAIASLYRKQINRSRNRAASYHRRCHFRCGNLTSTVSSSTFHQNFSSLSASSRAQPFFRRSEASRAHHRSSEESNVHQPHYFFPVKSQTPLWTCAPHPVFTKRATC